MATVEAQHLRVGMYGDTVVGDHTQVVYDEETGMIGAKKTVVAQTEDGETAIFVTEHVRMVGQMPGSDPPGYSPSRNHQKAVQYDVNNSRSTSGLDESAGLAAYWKCCWFLSGCCVFLMSLAIIIPIAAVDLITCSPLFGSAVTGYILGPTALLLSCVCCAYFFINENRHYAIHCLCCCTVLILVTLFFATLIPNTVFIAQNIDFIYSPNSDCNVPSTSVAVMALSYVLLVMFGGFCLCSTGQCLKKCYNSIMEDDA